MLSWIKKLLKGTKGGDYSLPTEVQKAKGLDRLDKVIKHLNNLGYEAEEGKSAKSSQTHLT
tara:strand:+ start:120 stop:302 length:183 start_codon:yes stop_codon:yes gene_type:complete